MFELWRRFQYYLHRGRFESELDEEMRHHLSLKAEDHGGAAPFGNVTRLKEDSRAMWNWRIVEQLAQDIRYAGRAMRANPLFTATAALSLALGIGANTAIYSFMDAILMRALPVQQPENLVILHWRTTAPGRVVHGINGTMRPYGKKGRTSPNFPYAALDRLAADHNTLGALFGYAYEQNVNLVIQNRADAATFVPVSGNFYGSLGIVPAAGRLIGPDDDRPGAPLITVLSYDYWKKRFAGNPAVIGQTILADNMPMTIAGVCAPGFFGLNPGTRPDLYIPIHARPLFSVNPAEQERQMFFDDHSYWVEIMGRLRPGVTLDRAQAALGTQFHQFVESTVTSEKERANLPELWLEPGSSGLDSLRATYSQPLRVLMTMVALILTIACANLANLLLARSSARRREMAVRLSLGAGRWRIVRQLLTESLVLALMGGALGVAFAWWGIQSITWLIANGRENFTLHAQLNWPVLGFTLALTLFAGLLFGLAPAIEATKLDLTPALKTRTGEKTLRRAWLGRIGATHVLVAAQIAMSLLLVIGAGLFVKNLVNLNSVELGFNRENLLVFNLNPRQAGYTGDAAIRFFSGVEDRIRQLPGVRAVGMSSFPLVSRYTSSTDVTVEGAAVTNKADVNLLEVDADFLATLQIPLLMGRGIEARDLATPETAVVNHKFAATFFGTENPLGRRFTLGTKPPSFQIVGVTRNAHYNSIEEDEEPVAYLPYTRNSERLSRMFFAVRTPGNPLSLANAVREIVHQASPTVLVTGVNTESRIIDQSIGQQRTFADLGTCFAVLALLIACVGLYGAMAYGVARRTSEIGIRMALGARHGAILWMVMREVLLLAVVGLAAGYGASRWLSKWIASFLWGMKPNDPVALAASIAVLLVAAAIAGFLPAWRASHIHPMTALRNE